MDELPWIAEVLATDTAGLMYWQYGDDLSTGLTNNDGYAIYYGSADYTTLVSLNFFFFFFLASFLFLFMFLFAMTLGEGGSLCVENRANTVGLPRSRNLLLL